MMQETKIQVQYINIDCLRPYPNNPNIIIDEDLDRLCNCIQEDPLYFETRTVICSNRTGKNIIIAGEKRYLSAIKLQLQHVQFAVIPDLTEEDEIRILFKDNGSFGQWNTEELKQRTFDFSQLKDWG